MTVLSLAPSSLWVSQSLTVDFQLKDVLCSFSQAHPAAGISTAPGLSLRSTKTCTHIFWHSGNGVLVQGHGCLSAQVAGTARTLWTKGGCWCLTGLFSFSVSKLLLCSWCHLYIWVSVCTSPFMLGVGCMSRPLSFECILSIYHQTSLPASHQGRIAGWMVAWHLNPLTPFDYPCSPLSRAWWLRDWLSLAHLVTSRT